MKIRFLLIFLISSAILISIYLLSVHYYVYTDISYKSICAITKKWNCDTVAENAYSVFLGLPVALWGMIGYFFLLFICIQAFLKRKLYFYQLSLLISGVFCLVSIIMGLLSTYKIKSYCMFCFGLYVINAAIFYIIYTQNRSMTKHSLKNTFISLLNDKGIKKISIFFIISIVSLMVFMPKYWEISPSDHSSVVAKGFTDQRNPWIGATNPVTTIYEYSDYTCFSCYKLHVFMRDFISKNHDRVRLVHMNYPLDKKYNSVVVTEDFHEGAGDLALLSVYSSERDDFWQINDALYLLGRQNKRLTLKEIVNETGLEKKDVLLALNAEYYQKLLSLDILNGMRKRILSTPSYVIDGIVYEGFIPAEVLEKALSR